MDFPSAPMSQLKEFGVSVYAARAYLALLDLGTAEARGVSELANIPTAKVYGTLMQLQRRGLAEVTPGKPRKYSAVPMEEFLDRRMREQLEELEDIRERKQELMEMFPIRGTATVQKRPQTTTVEGRRNVLQHLREACASARESVFIVMSPRLRADLSLRRLLDATAARGVRVHQLDDVLRADIMGESVVGETLAAARGTHDEAVLLATFDEHLAMLVHLPEPPRKDPHRREAAIHTTEPGFVHPLRRLLAQQYVLRQRSDRGLGAPTRPTAGSRVDARTFDRLVVERAAQPAATAWALLRIPDGAELERDRLWVAANGASHARVLLSVPPRRTLGAEVRPRPTTEVKVLPRPAAVSFAVLDGHQAFFISPSRAAREKAEDALHATTTDAAVVRAFEAEFEASWAAAMPLS